MRLDQPRIEPLALEAMDPESRKMFGGRVFNIFRTLAHHPKLMKRWLVFGNHILSKSTLPPREREIPQQRHALPSGRIVLHCL